MAEFKSYSSSTNDLLKSILKALQEQNKILAEQLTVLQSIINNQV